MVDVKVGSTLITRESHPYIVVEVWPRAVKATFGDRVDWFYFHEDKLLGCPYEMWKRTEGYILDVIDVL